MLNKKGNKNEKGLKKYRSKRRFESTNEPYGSERGCQQGNRFVVHRHKATHLHYDLRLEMDGVLKSWAVPKGLSEEVGIKRLAVQVEDHPLDYIDFEGIIPEGNYGAGAVEIWDRGTYLIQKRTSKHIDFIFSGKRLKGPYSLIYMSGKNWLIIKRKMGDGRRQNSEFRREKIANR